jgi:hypothetical protein
MNRLTNTHPSLIHHNPTPIDQKREESVSPMWIEGELAQSVTRG